MRVQALPRSMVRRQQRASVLSFVIAASTLWAGPSAALQPAEGDRVSAQAQLHSNPTPTHHPDHPYPTSGTVTCCRLLDVCHRAHVMSCCAGLHVRVPAGYAQLADSKNVREQLRRTRGPAAGDHHTTVLYTMDGGVYYKR